jgi:DeoR family transcriptional regulator, catabolite repression regulator
MPLNDKQIRILRAIEQGNITGESIAEALSSSMPMLRYYLDTMAEDGYLKAAKVYDNDTREFQIVRAYLTEKGKAELEQSTSDLPNLEDASRSQKKTEITPSQISIYDLNEVHKALETLSVVVDRLPESRRELAIIYLSDLQDEIKIAYRRRPERIKAYFIAVLGMILPIAKQIEQVDRFIESARILSKKLNVPVKLP